MVEKVGAISGQHFREIGLEPAFALPNLLGAAFFGSLPVFGRNLVGIDQGLRPGGSRCEQGYDGNENELFQMGLLKLGATTAEMGATLAQRARPPQGVLDKKNRRYDGPV